MLSEAERPLAAKKIPLCGVRHSLHREIFL